MVTKNTQSYSPRLPNPTSPDGWSTDAAQADEPADRDTYVLQSLLVATGHVSSAITQHAASISRMDPELRKSVRALLNRARLTRTAAERVMGDLIAGDAPTDDDIDE